MLYSYPHIPERMMRSLERYRLEHRSVGGFLQAIIANDLAAAITRADEENKNIDALQDYVWYIHNDLPAPANNYEAWTTCLCEVLKLSPERWPNGKPTCLVHEWTPEMIEAAR